MKLSKKWLLYLSIVSTELLANYSSFLPLPSEFAKRPIYYVYAHQLDDFSCGYNVLFNACCLEHNKVRYNKFSSKELFKKTIRNYLVTKKAKPHNASTSYWLHELAPRVLLKNFNYLILEKQKVRPLCASGIQVEYTIGTPKNVIEKMVAQAWEKKEEQLIKKLRKKLVDPCCLHFACHCKPHGVDHVVLITLVCDVYRRKSLYIFDNLNNTIAPKGEIAHYIHWMIKKFTL